MGAGRVIYTLRFLIPPFILIIIYFHSFVLFGFFFGMLLIDCKSTPRISDPIVKL